MRSTEQFGFHKSQGRASLQSEDYSVLRMDKYKQNPKEKGMGKNGNEDSTADLYPSFLCLRPLSTVQDTDLIPTSKTMKTYNHHCLCDSISTMNKWNRSGQP